MPLLQFSWCSPVKLHSVPSSPQTGASGGNTPLCERSRHRCLHLNMISRSHNCSNYQDTIIQSHGCVTSELCSNDSCVFITGEDSLNQQLCLKERKSNTDFLYLQIQYTTLLIIPAGEAFIQSFSNWLLSQWPWPVHQLTSSFGVFKCFRSSKRSLWERGP